MSDDVLREVDELVEQKDKFQTWLQKLEAQREKFPERSFEKVRGDYLKRLEEVSDKLRDHSDVVRAKLDELGQQAVDLEVEKAAQGDELEEARLRHTVGEYTDEEEWSDLENRLTDSLHKAEEKLQTAQEEVDRLKNIVAQLAGAEAEPAPTEAEAEDDMPPEPATAVEAASTPASEESSDDEGMVFLEELVGGGDEALQPDSGLGDAMGAAQAGPAAEEAQPASAATDGDLGDEMAFLESLSLDKGGESNAFSFLEGQGSGTPQTIICPHCSAANDPVEWYCTECGEELPAE
ncbi:MAG: hypothetical protein V3T08_00705 [Gemmatimonadota bacterium]